MEDNLDFDAEFRVRLPSSLAERIAETATKERRSRNMQYVHMLETWFELTGDTKQRISSIETKIAEITGDSSKREKEKIPLTRRVAI